MAFYCHTLFEGASAADIEVVCAALRRTTLMDVQLHAVGLSGQSRAAMREAAAAAPQLLLEIT